MSIGALATILVLLTQSAWWVNSNDSLEVGMTLVEDAASFGAFCLDGSLPAYHLDRGSGDGADNWVLFFSGGGWCTTIDSCLERSKTKRGSSNYMSKTAIFAGMMSNNASRNPDFYNWNRVSLRYCDGGSFAGDAKFDNGTSVLYFRGQKIWEAIIHDLLPKGLGIAKKALLTGCSAGGLTTFLQCDNFASYLSKNATVKCMSDAGFFQDEVDISSNYPMRSDFVNFVSLQGVEKNLNKECTSAMANHSSLCIFPQYSLKYIKTPFFVVNSAYDVYQFHHGLAPPSADPQKRWRRCKLDPRACDANQTKALEGIRVDLIKSLTPFSNETKTGGVFINSCYSHCQAAAGDTWSGENAPKVNNKTIGEAVGDWFFDRKVAKYIENCSYPCDNTCHNLLPAKGDGKIWMD